MGSITDQTLNDLNSTVLDCEDILSNYEAPVLSTSPSIKRKNDKSLQSMSPFKQPRKEDIDQHAFTLDALKTGTYLATYLYLLYAHVNLLLINFKVPNTLY